MAIAMVSSPSAWLAKKAAKASTTPAQTESETVANLAIKGKRDETIDESDLEDADYTIDPADI